MAVCEVVMCQSLAHVGTPFQGAGIANTAYITGYNLGDPLIRCVFVFVFVFVHFLTLSQQEGGPSDDDVPWLSRCACAQFTVQLGQYSCGVYVHCQHIPSVASHECDTALDW